MRITSILVLVVALSGCSWLKGKGLAAGTAFVDCAKADIGQTVADIGMTLLGVVAQIVEAGADGWKQELDTLGLKYGGDAEACAVLAVETVLTAGPSATASMSPGALRARDFITAKAWKFHP